MSRGRLPRQPSVWGRRERGSGAGGDESAVPRSRRSHKDHRGQKHDGRGVPERLAEAGAGFAQHTSRHRTDGHQRFGVRPSVSRAGPAGMATYPCGVSVDTIHRRATPLASGRTGGSSGSRKASMAAAWPRWEHCWARCRISESNQTAVLNGSRQGQPQTRRRAPFKRFMALRQPPPVGLCEEAALRSTAAGGELLSLRRTLDLRATVLARRAHSALPPSPRPPPAAFTTRHPAAKNFWSADCVVGHSHCRTKRPGLTSRAAPGNWHRPLPATAVGWPRSPTLRGRSHAAPCGEAGASRFPHDFEQAHQVQACLSGRDGRPVGCGATSSCARRTAHAPDGR